MSRNVARPPQHDTDTRDNKEAEQARHNAHDGDCYDGDAARRTDTATRS
jgi:hypothetical protein